MTEFSGQTVIVTGGAKGIGRGICEAFAREGAKVLCADVDTAAGEEVCAAAAEAAGEIRFIEADVGQSAACRRTVDTAIEQWGRVDVLCNNAGIQPPHSYLPAHELPEDMWDRIIDVNLKSAFILSALCLPHMKERGAGVIINTASVQGLQSAKGVSAYAASKGGLLSLTRQLAVEYGEFGIRVLAVNPGTIDTPLVDEAVEAFGGDKAELILEWNETYPLRRIGQPADVADAMLFLASRRASFITGEYLNVDGGIMARGSWG
jgi:NAD(P)-dependent dehydrogenase (short-subunit alcohol dehydrogenase family)